MVFWKRHLTCRSDCKYPYVSGDRDLDRNMVQIPWVQCLSSHGTKWQSLPQNTLEHGETLHLIIHVASQSLSVEFPAELTIISVLTLDVLTNNSADLKPVIPPGFIPGISARDWGSTSHDESWYRGSMPKMATRLPILKRGVNCGGVFWLATGLDLVGFMCRFPANTAVWQIVTGKETKPFLSPYHSPIHIWLRYCWIKRGLCFSVGPLTPCSAVPYIHPVYDRP